MQAAKRRPASADFLRCIKHTSNRDKLLHSKLEWKNRDEM
jgi:hypothetical protein